MKVFDDQRVASLQRRRPLSKEQAAGLKAQLLEALEALGEGQVRLGVHERVGAVEGTW